MLGPTQMFTVCACSQHKVAVSCEELVIVYKAPLRGYGQQHLQLCLTPPLTALCALPDIFGCKKSIVSLCTLLVTCPARTASLTATRGTKPPPDRAIALPSKHPSGAKTKTHIPSLWRKGVIGVLGVGAKNRDTATASDRRLMITFAAHDTE